MKKVLIDCDPGIDDMIAIILACASEEIDVLGITTVAGNQLSEKTFQNAIKTLSLIKRTDIEVSKGCDKPLIRELSTASSIHGKTGLNGAIIPIPLIKESKLHAIDFIIDILLKQPNKIYILAMGPLTNIALAILKEPKIKEKIERLIIMGGGIWEFNVTPCAEFNIFVDPDAAKIILGSGLIVTLITLDVTNKAILNKKDIKIIEKFDGEVSKILAAILMFNLKRNKKYFNINGAVIHDALTVAHLIKPGIIKTKFLNVEVETNSELTRGKTVIDFYRVTNRKPNADVSIKLNLPMFKNLILNSLEKIT